MAMIKKPDSVEIFKWRAPGPALVALCFEVAAYVRSGEADRDNVDLQSATYEEDAKQLAVRFAVRGARQARAERQGRVE